MNHRTRFLGPAVHLLDAENLLGGPAATPDAVGHLWRTYRYGIPTAERDQFRMGVSRFVARRAALALPGHGVRLLVASGGVGAEEVLIESIDLEHLARRYDRLVIASGDHRFTPLARAARELELHVHVVVGVGACARSLHEAATTRSRLRLTSPAPTAPAAVRRITRSA